MLFVQFGMKICDYALDDNIIFLQDLRSLTRAHRLQCPTTSDRTPMTGPISPNPWSLRSLKPRSTSRILLNHRAARVKINESLGRDWRQVDPRLPRTKNRRRKVISQLESLVLRRPHRRRRKGFLIRKNSCRKYLH